jgi:hypothetical protein
MKLLRPVAVDMPTGRPARVLRRLDRGFGDQVLKNRTGYLDYRRPTL